MIEPRRLALQYEPPSIVVEYTYHKGPVKELYHHVINLKTEFLSLSASRFNEYRINEIVNSIIKQHPDFVGNCKIRSTQLDRLVRKLINHQRSAQEPPPTTNSILPQADYNRVSETQLKQIKQKMDIVFQQNILLPEQAGYQYDKQINFQEATESTDWDD